MTDAELENIRARQEADAEASWADNFALGRAWVADWFTGGHAAADLYAEQLLEHGYVPPDDVSMQDLRDALGDTEDRNQAPTVKGEVFKWLGIGALALVVVGGVAFVLLPRVADTARAARGN